MTVTVRKIAKEARVSIGTVSRALRHAPGVSADRAAMVRAVAAKLNYSPPTPRTPRRSAEPLRGKAIALLLLGTEGSLTSLPVVAAALHGVEAAMAAAGGAMVLAESPNLDAVPPALETQRIEGVILKGALEGDSLARSGGRLLRRLEQVPAVWLLGRPTGCDWGDAVGTDNVAAGRIAAEFLLERGHRHVAFMSTVVRHPLIDQRQWGFEHAIRRAGGRVEPIVIDRLARTALPERRTQPAEADELAERFLQLSPRPTAIFSAFDSLSALLQPALQRRGVRIGSSRDSRARGEVQMMSCNHERSLTEPLDPPLPTIDIDAHGIGRKAVELLASRLEKPRDSTAITWSLRPKLVVR